MHMKVIFMAPGRIDVRLRSHQIHSDSHNKSSISFNSTCDVVHDVKYDAGIHHNNTNNKIR